MKLIDRKKVNKVGCEEKELPIDSKKNSSCNLQVGNRNKICLDQWTESKINE